MAAGLRPRLRQRHRRHRDGARHLHGGPRAGQRPHRAPRRCSGPCGPTPSWRWGSRPPPSSPCPCCAGCRASTPPSRPCAELTGTADVLARARPRRPRADAGHRPPRGDPAPRGRGPGPPRTRRAPQPGPALPAEHPGGCLGRASRAVRAPARAGDDRGLRGRGVRELPGGGSGLAVRPRGGRGAWKREGACASAGPDRRAGPAAASTAPPSSSPPWPPPRAPSPSASRSCGPAPSPSCSGRPSTPSPPCSSRSSSASPLGALVYERVRTRAGRPEALLGPLFLAAGLCPSPPWRSSDACPKRSCRRCGACRVRFEAHALMRPSPLPRHPAARDHAPRHHLPAAACIRPGAGGAQAAHGAPLRLEHRWAPSRAPWERTSRCSGPTACRDRASSSPACCSAAGAAALLAAAEAAAAPSGPGRGRGHRLGPARRWPRTSGRGTPWS